MWWEGELYLRNVRVMPGTPLGGSGGRKGGVERSFPVIVKLPLLSHLDVLQEVSFGLEFRSQVECAVCPRFRYVVSLIRVKTFPPCLLGSGDVYRATNSLQ